MADKSRLLRRFHVHYLGLYFFHVLHVLEELWGEFRAVRILGKEGFLAANVVLLAIPLIVFVFILEDKPVAIRLGRIYAAIMILNGLGHNLAFLISGRYFGFAAGGISGIGLIIFGLLAASSLQKVKDFQ